MHKKNTYQQNNCELLYFIDVVTFHPIRFDTCFKAFFSVHLHAHAQHKNRQFHETRKSVKPFGTFYLSSFTKQVSKIKPFLSDIYEKVNLQVRY